MTLQELKKLNLKNGGNFFRPANMRARGDSMQTFRIRPAGPGLVMVERKSLPGSWLFDAAGRVLFNVNIRARIAALAKAAGATVEDDSSERFEVLQVCAPEGQQWRDGGCTSLRVEWTLPISPKDAAAIVDDTYNRIACGLEPVSPENL